MNITAELRDWKIHTNNWGQYATGKIFDDKKNRWRNGTLIHTSQIKSTAPALEGLILITLNSSYLIKADYMAKEKPLEARTEVLLDEATLLAFI